MAGVRLPKNYLRAAAARLRCQPQAGAADDARRQLALHAEPLLGGDHRFASPSADLSELSAADATYGPQPALWVADITYIRLRTEFVYLAVVLEAFSRRVIGWALGRTLEAELAVAALRMALIERRPAPGLVHHSDRGVQYASQAYTEMLKQHQAIISMSRKGNPYDNAACESFMKTLKYEEVYRNEYRDFHDAHTSIGEFLELVYNQKRLHSALGYVPPAESRMALPNELGSRPHDQKRGLCPCDPGI